MCGAIIIRDDVDLNIVHVKEQIVQAGQAGYARYAWQAGHAKCSRFGALKSRHCSWGTTRNPAPADDCTLRGYIPA